MCTEATEQTSCGVRLANPPRIDRTRAAMAYLDLARSLALWLKYGRKVAIARYMAPLVNSGENCLLIPALLHRTRLWNRGFNQSALVARELSRRLGIAAVPIVLQRTPCPPLKGMSPLLRRKTVAGAFGVRDKAAVAGNRKHRRGLRSGAQACPSSANRAGELGACGETFAVDAFMLMPKYPA